ncbi:MAG TPA: MBL fold metallo-hydrolase, partial [Chitinophagaceae bacterium]|nr:MBL fold metallo-hydrolase [Chitinophagaceae bacterium]
MKIAFHGAAHCVTGSKHLISLKSGKQVLLDCGMFQGMGKDTDELNRTLGFEASQVTAMILSHAHIDHSGLIPKLCSEGFSGKIHCTPATKDLTNVLLQDSAHIQQEDARFANKRRAAQGLPYIKPLYTVEDAQNCISQFATHEYGDWFEVIEGVQCMFTDAGHIIGSQVVNLK